MVNIFCNINKHEGSYYYIVVVEYFIKLETLQL